jgi:CHAT domain-containing protein
MATSAIVDTATHAVMNARNPLFSRLELARDRGMLSGNDGRLEVREVLEMRVRSPLVFLSGCDTGLGASWSTPFETGEDFTTLAQALLFAGARNVVATLWRIDDAAAAELAERFYQNLRTVPAPEALVQAQRSLLREAKYRDPYYWAAYQLSGGESLDSTFAQSEKMSVERLKGGRNPSQASLLSGRASK